MCGIAGIIGSKENCHNIQQMLEVQKHRGPDAAAIWQENGVTLGHNRLSIIDLSQAADQPMVSNCGNYTIVFNGEIYNYIELKQELSGYYAFKTTSDTEVLLAAFIKWKEKALEKLNGMFSFAIWNAKQKRLFVARDRFGVKPLYYTFFEAQFYFSSEIKTLFAAGIPKSRNQKVWAGYFVNGSYGLPEETFWNTIEQLPGGHYMEVEFEKLEPIKPIKWYDFPERISKIEKMTVPELKSAYEKVLNDAIKLRFRADVPLGMNVSGGLDSSALIALVNENLSSDTTIEAFTFYSNDAKYDELPWVAQLLQNLPYQSNKVLLKVDEIPDLIQKISYFQDEPFGGFPTIAYSLLFQEAKKRKIPVVLDGQGMDEAWAGYDYYHNNSNTLIQGLKSSPVRPEVLDADFQSLAANENYPKPFASQLQNLQYRDLFYTKLPRALRFNDRISMMHSTELREPFLDYRLVELAFAQNDALKIQNGQTKWLLRDLVKERLGEKIALAPKRAVQTPQREWIATELKDYFSTQIAVFSKSEFVDKKQVARVWKMYCDGNQDNSFYLWQWINSAQL